MKAVVQRVESAKVVADGELSGEIGKGLAVLLGAAVGDTEKEAMFLAKKTANLRIFEDGEGKMNLSVKNIGGEILVVSNFTLCADASSGNRPSYINAERPEKAERLIEIYKESLKSEGINIASGVFGAEMKITQVDDGPVTIILDSTELMK